MINKLSNHFGTTLGFGIFSNPQNDKIECKQRVFDLLEPEILTLLQHNLKNIYRSNKFNNI